MCQSLQTKQGQSFLPDFLTQGFGAGKMQQPPSSGAIRNAADVPMGDSADRGNELAIKERRERIRKEQERQKQAKESPGSHRPTSIRSRKDIMDELT